MVNKITKIEQFKKQILEVVTDYKVITDDSTINYILETTNTKVVNGDWSDQCHSDSNPDCAKKKY